MRGTFGWQHYGSVLGSLLFFLSGAQAQNCEVRALVSGYYSNVHVYDACTGEFLRRLDESGRIRGPQAVKLGPDGRVWVVSEEAGTILRYDRGNLDYVDTFATVGATWGVTGLDFVGDNTVYLGSYATGKLRRYDIASGDSQDVPATAVLRGPDNGLTKTPDGQLLIPGYDSNNVVRFDPASGQFSVFVPAGSNGLRATRGLLFNKAGNKVYVTGERSNQVLRYNYPSGTLDKIIATSISTPTGIAWYDDSTLLVAGSGRLGAGVLKIDAESGEEKSLLIRIGSGGLAGPTYVALIPASSDQAEVPNEAAIGSQYWLTALGRLNGTRVELEANTALGSHFGTAFNPAEVRKPRWGQMTLNFLNCKQAELTWTSRGEDSARFGAGGYRIERMLNTPTTAACERTGIAGAPDSTWLQGAWYGGPPRDGEGFMLDTDGNGLVFLTWFTYRPTAP